MPSSVFKPIDRPYFIDMLEENNTHATLGKYEMGLDVDFSDAPNKTERARRIIQYLFDQPNTDELMIALLDRTYVEGAYAHRRREEAGFERLNEKVLNGRGVALTDEGFQISDASEPNISTDREPANPPKSAPLRGVPVKRPTASSVSAAQVRDPKRVFLVHGRDTRPYKVLEMFLHFVDLKVVSWAEATDLTEKAQPTTYEIVKAGIDAAAATIVIWSPDDEAQLTTDLAGDDSDAARIRPQARQNVILEAGIAYGTAPERTIFVQSGYPMRMPSDVQGFNWIKLDGTWDSRKGLIKRLARAKADPKPHEEDLLHQLAGPFAV